MTIDRGFRRIALSLSVAASAADGWLGYRDVQVSQMLTVCDEIAPAHREFHGKPDVDALALYREKHDTYYDADGKRLPDQGAVARASAQAEVQYLSNCHGPVQRILTVGLWGLMPFAAVWAAFFFIRWIVMGFRGVAR